MTSSASDISMARQEIERAFIDAGWELFDPHSRYPIVGNAGDLSIIAHEQYVETDDPYFELVERRRVLSHWVRTIPTPRQAAVLLDNHGGLPEEERGNPYGG